jgi:hypothetical protein
VVEEKAMPKKNVNTLLEAVRGIPNELKATFTAVVGQIHGVSHSVGNKVMESLGFDDEQTDQAIHVCMLVAAMQVWVHIPLEDMIATVTWYRELWEREVKKMEQATKHRGKKKRTTVPHLKLVEMPKKKPKRVPSGPYKEGA